MLINRNGDDVWDVELTGVDTKNLDDIDLPKN